MALVRLRPYHASHWLPLASPSRVNVINKLLNYIHSTFSCFPNDAHVSFIAVINFEWKASRILKTQE